MNDWLDDPRIATIPVIRMAFALSIVLHALALWGWLPRMHELSLEIHDRGKAGGPLVLELAPQPKPQVSPPSAPPAPNVPPAVPAPAPKRAPVAKAVPVPKPTPPVIAQEQPAPVAAPAPAAPAAAPAPAPMDGEFSAYVDARRRARGAAPDGGVPTPPSENERDQHNRAVAANLGLNRTPSYGTDRTSGGVFRIERLSADSAEFIFFGWNKEIARNSSQRIDVRKGNAPDIRVAVVRRMIVLIRERESGNFDWISPRLGRTVTLSARPGDDSGLEDFLMQEFFSGAR